jgi:hypothetical protein
MSILDSIVGASNGAAVQQLAKQFGIPPEQAAAAVGALMPAVAGGLKRNADVDESKLASALTTGAHERYLDQPDALTKPETALDGNAILGHIFGNKEASREVATNASQKTGIDPAILKKMLPIVAAMAMGALAKQTKSGGAGMQSGTAGKGGIGAMLGPLLDRDRDGSAVDDITGMLGGMLKHK